MNITVNGNVNLTAPTTNIKGNVKIDGTLDVTQDISTDANVKAAAEVSAMTNATAVNLSTHTHQTPGLFPGPITATSLPGQG